MAGGTEPRIGSIDLGLMGSTMLQRLQSLDYAVTVFAFSRKIKSLQW